jgi:hypothetical protein
VISCHQQFRRTECFDLGYQCCQLRLAGVISLEQHYSANRGVLEPGSISYRQLDTFDINH